MIIDHQPLEFSTEIADGIKDLRKNFLDIGTLNLLFEGSRSNSEDRGWSSILTTDLLFLLSALWYSSLIEVCFIPMILLARFTILFSLFFCTISRKPYQHTILNVKILSIMLRYTVSSTSVQT